MRFNILIGGRAGQGINKISEILSRVLIKWGYFTFNYRDYQSLIRGGHNFNILSISNEWIGSAEEKLDGIIALDDKTIDYHKKDLKKDGFVIDSGNFEDLGRNLNICLAGAALKIFGIPVKIFMNEIKKEFNNQEALECAEAGYESEKGKFELKKLDNKIRILSGNNGISQGAVNSGISLYLAYPMTPATGVMHELAEKQRENKLVVFQPENEISVVNMALGANFAGARTFIGTAGGGFDLMTEALSFQGQSEIPLVVYLASRPGPGTGIPTYTSQADLNVALNSGHGEFPRVVVAPGDPLECMEKTNEAFYLSEKFGTLAIILSDKHLAESEFSISKNENEVLKINSKINLLGSKIVKASSYEHDNFGNTIENPEIAKQNADKKMEKYRKMKKECENFEMIKTHGRKDSKNLIISWGSTKGAILDAIRGLDVKFLQILYLKPLSEGIKGEMMNAKKIILVENNLTGQLGYLLRQKTGIKIEERILKYDGRPFFADELKKEIEKRLK